MKLDLTFDGHRVRVVGTPEQPEWVAKDVCRVLSLHGASHIARDIPAVEKGVAQLATPGGPQPVVTVTEPGLYRLISRSRKPAAQRFQAWLFGEVLPSIRQHGCYPPPSERPAGLPANLDLHDPAQLAAVTVQALQLVAEYQPKAEALDRLAAAGGDLSIRKVAKVLHIPEREFVAKLLAEAIAFRDNRGRLEPYAKHVSAGYFRVRTVIIGDHAEDVTTQALVTPAGLVWLDARYNGRPRALPAGQTPLVLQ